MLPGRFACFSAAALTIILSLLTSTARAQGTTGDIHGIVVDGSGKPLPDVTVTITNTATAATREVMTNAEGLFAAPAQPCGPYEVQAALRGYAPRRQPDVHVEVGKTISLRLELRTAPAAETITIAETLPVLETTRTHISSVVNSVDLEHLPVRDGNFMDLVALTPRIPDNGTRTISIDGGESESPHAFSQQAVQEFGVNASAGAIDVITRSGSNDLAGSVFEFHGSDALNSNTAINRQFGLPKPRYDYDQFGGAIGGPIAKNKHFFFATYEGQRGTEASPVFINVPPDTPSSSDTQSGIARLSRLAIPWDRTRDQDVWFVKSSHHLSNTHQLTLRYNHQNFSGRSLDSRGVPQSFERTSALETTTRSFVGVVYSVLGASLVNEARFQYARDRDASDPNSAVPQADIRQGGSLVLGIGRSVFSPRSLSLRRFQIADTLSWVHGRHSVKSGIDVRLDDVVGFLPANVSGSYVFNSLAAFNRGVPSGRGDTYTQAFVGADTTGATAHPDVGDYSLFAQDEWRVTQDLSVNLGMRYDVESFTRPPSVKADRNNFGPRLGAAWAPEGQRYVVRGAFGVIYGRTASVPLLAAFSNNGVNLRTITFRGAGGDPLPTYPGRFSAIPAGASIAPPSIFTFDAGYQNARVQQASAGFEWEWMPNTSIAASYVFVKGDHLPRSTDTNLGASIPVTLTLADAAGNTTGTISHYRFARGPLTNLSRVVAFQSTAESRYHGLTVEWNRRHAQGFRYRLAYTLGAVEDTAPDASAVVLESLDDRKFASNPTDFDVDRAPGNNDRRHVLVASIVYSTSSRAESFDGLVRTLMKDWTISGIYAAQTGLPFSAYASTDINGDNNRFNDVAPGTARNQYRLPASISFDPRIARDIEAGGTRISIVWEAFNLLNRANYTVVNDTLYDAAGTQLRVNPLFGQMLGQSNPRMMQLAVKLSF